MGVMPSHRWLLSLYVLCVRCVYGSCFEVDDGYCHGMCGDVDESSRSYEVDCVDAYGMRTVG